MILDSLGVIVIRKRRGIERMTPQERERERDRERERERLSEGLLVYDV